MKAAAPVGAAGPGRRGDIVQQLAALNDDAPHDYESAARLEGLLEGTCRPRGGSHSD